MPSGIVNHFSNKTGKSKEEIESLWNESKDIAKEQYEDLSEQDSNFYQIVTNVLKELLGLNEEGEVNNPAMTTSTMGDLQYRKPTMYQKRFDEKRKKNKKKPVLIYDPDNMK
jgi:coenzyme F420-reducing hydrogenase alpha subunit